MSSKDAFEAFAAFAKPKEMTLDQKLKASSLQSTAQQAKSLPEYSPPKQSNPPLNLPQNHINGDTRPRKPNSNDFADLFSASPASNLKQPTNSNLNTAQPINMAKNIAQPNTNLSKVPASNGISNKSITSAVTIFPDMILNPPSSSVKNNLERLGPANPSIPSDNVFDVFGSKSSTPNSIPTYTDSSITHRYATQINANQLIEIDAPSGMEMPKSLQSMDIFNFAELSVEEPLSINNDPFDFAFLESKARLGATIVEVVTKSLPDSGSENLVDDSFDLKLAKLVELGYDPKLASKTLELQNGNLENAVELLIKTTVSSTAPISHGVSKMEGKKSDSEIGSGPSLRADPMTVIFGKAKNIYEYSKSKIAELVQSQKNDLIKQNDFIEPQQDYSYHETFIGEQDFGSELNPIPIKNIDDDLRVDKVVVSQSIPVADLLSGFSDTNRQPIQNISIGNLLDSPPMRQESTLNTTNISDTRIFGKHATDTKHPTINASSIQIAESESYKSLGNDAFKRGQFEEAVLEYTKAIEVLPPLHPRLVNLFNNRCSSYLKTGQYSDCITDCKMTLDIDPGNIKSMLRRASAYEALENWELAMIDYKFLMGIDPSAIISQGISRCNQAIAPKLHTKKDPVPSEADIHRIQIQMNEAVQKVRLQNIKDEEESTQKFEMKDQIDLKVF